MTLLASSSVALAAVVLVAVSAPFVGLVALALLVSWNLGFRAFRTRVHGRKFERFETTQGPGLETELGRIWIDRRAGVLRIQRKGGEESFVPLADLWRVGIQVGRAEATVEELFFEGWTITDFFGRFRDRRITWEIAIGARHGSIPVATLSQYDKRDFFDLATPVQLWILGKLGLYRPGCEVAGELECAVAELLREGGVRGHGLGTPSPPGR